MGSIPNYPRFGEKVAGARYILRPGGYVIVHNSHGDIAVLSTPEGYFLPGGGQENGETLERTAIREAFEECGVRIEITGSIGTADELVFEKSEGKYYRKQCTFFSADLVRREAGCEDNTELLWMRAEDAARLLSHESQTWAVTEISESQP
jgi:8-oxo-dGTP diphosphatase